MFSRLRRALATWGITEVEPEPGVSDDPALASTDLASVEPAAHKEARRLARLLVSEIMLYNAEAVEKGRRHGDLYQRLKDDIDHSRRMYEEQIDRQLVGGEDYFQQELIQRLAGGNAELLGR